jgi:FkbM family methyltransferase
MYNNQYIRQVGFYRWFLRNLIRQWHKRIRRSPHSMVLPTRAVFQLPLDSHLASEVFVSGGDIDLGSEAIFYNLIQKNSIVYDVGANVGYYSVYISPKVARCYAFEPSLRTGKVLACVTAGFSNITHIAKAVSSKSGRATFYEEPDMEVSGLRARSSVATAVEVEVITLDEFSELTPGKVDAIKIDVEGFDFEVLLGAKQLLHRDQPLVLTEAKMDRDLADFAKACGYRIFANIWADGRSRTVELSQPGADTKMVFLVPLRLYNAFEDLVAKSL